MCVRSQGEHATRPTYHQQLLQPGSLVTNQVKGLEWFLHHAPAACHGSLCSSAEPGFIIAYTFTNHNLHGITSILSSPQHHSDPSHLMSSPFSSSMLTMVIHCCGPVVKSSWLS
jgi:hypothetical protein